MNDIINYKALYEAEQAKLNKKELEARELLEKYELETDVESIIERTQKSYSDLLVSYIRKHNEPHSVYGIAYDSAFRYRWEEIQKADLTILCSLAKKCDRYEKLLNASILPTAEDVCKAMSEHLGGKSVVFNKEKQAFSVVDEHTGSHMGLIERSNNQVVYSHYFSDDYLTPILVKMAVCFFEGSR